MSPKKLIETSIPLEAINTASAREKSINHMHPSTLHLWWSRKPLATTRAVLWASLIDDPEDDQERKRLHEILARLVNWDKGNIVDPEALRQARAELPDPSSLPELLDPFAGGGSIPLEGQRLGLNVHAHDLNPTAVILNKAMIEFPAEFSGLPPVNPEARSLVGWENSGDAAHGLAQDIRYYGNRLRELAFAKLGSMYPTCRGRNVIAWLWARTVKCPNPACRLDVPLVSSWEFSAKQNVHTSPHYSADGELTFTVGVGEAPKSPKTGRGKFVCSACGGTVSNDYLHAEFCAHRDGVRMIGVVCEGENGRVYVEADEEQESAAGVARPEEYPDAEVMGDSRYVSPRLYGMPNFADLFTNRQLKMLTTIAELIPEVVAEAERDSEECRDRPSGKYAESLGVYLAFVLDKLADYHSSLCSWNVARDIIGHTFTRQALPMVWDYTEANPFSNSSGCFNSMLKQIADVVDKLPATRKGEASQHDAQQPESLRNVMISTDPPYYDNIGYADLSDYFYIWLRQTLRGTYPELFRRMLVPKDEELVAAPHRHEGSKAKSREFFESGMLTALKNLRECASDDYPTTIYYAYKSGKKDGANSGWETMLSAVINAGFQITGTWPMRTELTNRLLGQGTIALASSVVLVCRKRSPDAGSCGLSEFRRELREELGPALSTLLAGNIAAVDLPQSAIGPGMAVYSRYSDVSSSDGKSLTIHDALIEINTEVDEILGGTDMDSLSRFCVDVYRIDGWNAVKSGDAINIATGRGISLDALKNAGLIVDVKGSVSLTPRESLRPKSKCVWSLAQRLTLLCETGGDDKNGIDACARMIHVEGMAEAERARKVAYLLYKTANDKRLTVEARMYNQLVMSWPKILEAEAAIKQVLSNPQLTLNLQTED